MSLAALAGKVRSRKDLDQGSSVFEVDLDLGKGGVVVPISVHEETDLDAMSGDLARAHGLSETEQRRLAHYLRRRREDVIAGRV